MTDIISALAVLPPADPVMVSAQDLSFIQQAQESNLSEVSEAQLALNHTTNIGSQEFAHWMIGDHTGASNLLQTVATQLGVTLPTALDATDQTEANQLSTLSGTAFDRTYAQDGVTGHAATIASLQQEIATGENPTLVAYATQALPVVEAHYEQANILAGNPDTGAGTPAPTVTPPSATTTPSSTQDTTFVQDAAASSATEIAEGNIALGHTANVGAAEYERWMVADHTAATNSLATIASQDGFTVPTTITSDQQSEISTLQGVTDETQFAKTYASDGLVGHTNTLMQFITEAGTGSNPDLMAYAKSAIPTLVQHELGAVSLYANANGLTLPTGAGDLGSMLTAALERNGPTISGLGLTIPNSVASTLAHLAPQAAQAFGQYVEHAVQSLIMPTTTT